MSEDVRPRRIPARERVSRTARARRSGASPNVEPLEARQLLSEFSGFTRVRNILTTSGIYNLQIEGPGVLRAAGSGRGTVAVTVLGTTADSSLSITQLRPRLHVPNEFLTISSLRIRSGQIGSILAGSAELDGSLTPLSSSVDTLQFGALGRNAQIEIGGSVGSMNVQVVNLGPNGRVVIDGDLNGISQNGPQGTSAAMQISTLAIDGGRFLIGRDSLAPITIAGDLALMRNGLFSIGRDQAGSLAVGGSLVLDTGGQLSIGRNLSGLTVGGDLLVNPAASGIVVGGSLRGMRVDGIFRGQGSAAAIDLAVGLNLTGMNILGGTGDQGGLLAANISVGKNLNGLNVTHGIFRSWITAGVAIDGVTVGADGIDAILNSEISAGATITNVLLNGDVVSDFPTNPNATGYPTRIVAGKTRDGRFLPNGSITGLTIEGALIDSVLAASVAPFGGDGSLPPPVPYGGTPRSCGAPAPGYNGYNAPGGVTDLGEDRIIKNYSIRSLIEGQLLPFAVYDTAIDPNVDDCILENGTIQAVVRGGVVSTTPGSRLSPPLGQYDFTGVFAVNTLGVDGGLLPPP